MALGSIVKILVLLGCFFVLGAGDDDYIRIRLEAPSASPYRVIRYEITKRRPATTAVHRRALPGHAESLHHLGLMTREETEAIDALIVRTEAMSLPDATPTTRSREAGQLTWSVEVMRDGEVHAFRVTAPENQRDRRYAQLIDGVRDRVIAVAGTLPFRNVFFAQSQMGWLNLVSVPSAKVFIDDFDTHHTTPLYSYEVKAGVHSVRMETADGRLIRAYNVRVEPGGTTNLRVDLR